MADMFLCPVIAIEEVTLSWGRQGLSNEVITMVVTETCNNQEGYQIKWRNVIESDRVGVERRICL